MNNDTVSVLESLREWVLKKRANGISVMDALNDEWGLFLGDAQKQYMRGRIDQLEQMDNVIIEFMEEQNDRENGNV